MSEKTTRSVAAALCAVVGGVYLIIGLGLIDVVERPEGNPAVLAVLGAIYLAIAAALWLSGRVAIMIGAAAFQLMVIAGYLAIASSREPAFEGWGILLKIVEAVICAVLVYGVIHHVRAHAGPHQVAHAASSGPRALPSA